MQSPSILEGHARYPGSGVTKTCKPKRGCCELNSGPPEGL